MMLVFTDQGDFYFVIKPAHQTRIKSMFSYTLILNT